MENPKATGGDYDLSVVSSEGDIVPLYFLRKGMSTKKKKKGFFKYSKQLCTATRWRIAYRSRLVRATQWQYVSKYWSKALRFLIDLIGVC